MLESHGYASEVPCCVSTFVDPCLFLRSCLLRVGLSVKGYWLCKFRTMVFVVYLLNDLSGVVYLSWYGSLDMKWGFDSFIGMLVVAVE